MVNEKIHVCIFPRSGSGSTKPRFFVVLLESPVKNRLNPRLEHVLEQRGPYRVCDPNCTRCVLFMKKRPLQDGRRGREEQLVGHCSLGVGRSARGDRFRRCRSINRNFNRADRTRRGDGHKKINKQINKPPLIQWIRGFAFCRRICRREIPADGPAAILNPHDSPCIENDRIVVGVFLQRLVEQSA